jgi:5'-deoxynucleotidase YfbR-like HD superfamily hydrolase
VALTQVDDLRPGSLVERFRKCGKPTCHCAKPNSPGHGPSYSLTREVQSKTVTKIIPPSAVEQTRRQIAEYKRFRDLTREFVEVSDKVCDAQLQAADSASSEVKKNGARRGVAGRPYRRDSKSPGRRGH